MNCEKKQLRIAEVVGNAKSGGVPSCVMNFYRHVDHERFRFDFFTYGPSSYDEEIRALGGEVYYIPLLYHPTQAIKTLREIFEQNNYDIVHAHNTTLSCVPLYAAKKAGVKVRICHAHNTTIPREKTAVVKYLLRPFAPMYATHLAGCSKFSNLWLYGKKKGERAFVLRNAIDMDRFAPSSERREEIRARLGVQDKFVVGHVGRWVYQKNLPFLMQYFADLHAACPQTALVMVGSGPEKAASVDRLKKAGIEDSVYWISETTCPEAYYNAFDLFVLPSHYEGLPLVLVEAQTAGVPCLVSQAVTKEAALGDNVKFLPLQQEVWTKETLSIYEQPYRYDGRDIVREAGYDIAEEAKRLEEFYESTQL